MKFKFILVLMLGTLVLSCYNVAPEKPKKLISEEKMTNILYDLYIINSAKGIDKKVIANKGIIPEVYLLKKHDIDSAQFASSNAYYAYDTDAYNSILTNVKNRLEADKTTYEAALKKEGKTRKEKKEGKKILPNLNAKKPK